MTERERLTEHIGDGVRYYDGKYQQTCYPKNDNLNSVDKLAVKLCEFEDKIENGTLVELPCKVGDTVYAFCDCFGAILPYVVQNFGVGFMGKNRPNYWFWEATSHATETDELLDELDFDLDNIGKTLFLTKEEAEKALERSKG